MSPSEDVSHVNRRKYLAVLSAAGSIALSGCVVCATSVIVRDDYLRVAINDFSVGEGSFAGNAQILHRGPDNWDWDKPERETFHTNYENVRFLGYAHDGVKVLDIPMGDFDPGTTREEAFETETFPMVITAVPENVTYDVDCPHADVGAHVNVYAGKFESDTLPKWGLSPSRDPRRELQRRLDRYGAGHRWLPYSELPDYEGQELTTTDFQYAKCTQRALKGRDLNGPPDLSALPNTEQWLTRKERFTFTLWGHKQSISNPTPVNPAIGIPDRIGELIRTTDWSYPEGAIRVERSVSGRAWKHMIGELEGHTSPSYPACDGASTFCSDSWEYRTRGLCRAGRITAWYEFNPDRVLEDVTDSRRTLYWADKSILTMRYRWEGVLPRH